LPLVSAAERVRTGSIDCFEAARGNIRLQFLQMQVLHAFLVFTPETNTGLGTVEVERFLRLRMPSCNPGSVGARLARVETMVAVGYHCDGSGKVWYDKRVV
jgi:hypothetical protein